jgi:hypothetical protein
MDLKHIVQKDDLGCLIASAAMVFDLSYEEAAKTIPLQDPVALQSEGINLLGLAAFDAIERLAEERGKRIEDVFKPFVCRAGARYIAILHSPAQIGHAVAIDELGFVFDPAEETPSGECWSKYDFHAVLGFF